MKYLMMIAALLCSTVLYAVEVVVQWDAPTTYVNGDPLPPQNIVSYSVLSALTPGYAEQIVTTTTATFVVDPGLNCFVVSVLATNGLSSEYANVCTNISGDGPPGVPVFVCP